MFVFMQVQRADCSTDLFSTYFYLPSYYYQSTQTSFPPPAGFLLLFSGWASLSAEHALKENALKLDGLNIAAIHQLHRIVPIGSIGNAPIGHTVHINLLYTIRSCN